MLSVNIRPYHSMNKATFIYKMSFPLIGLGIFISSFAYIAVLRAALGIDESITMSFSTLVTTLVGGYMAALAGMITWVRLIAIKSVTYKQHSEQFLRKPHLIGLSFLIPIPFLSCLLLGWFWQKDRQFSAALDETYRETANFHVSLHLYLLISFFLMPIVIGFVMIALLFATFILATLYHLIRSPKSSAISRYPINIQIATI